MVALLVNIRMITPFLILKREPSFCKGRVCGKLLSAGSSPQFLSELLAE
jgi:hypothetical protein